jgi:hypothetical protein
VSAERHLTVAGEVHPDCAGCLAKDDIIRGLERDLNGWRYRYAELKRSKDEEARQHPLWPDAVRLFKFYCELTGKPGKPRKLTWDVERFEMIAPFLKKHGLGMCERAIVGRVFDHFVGESKNGRPVHYHEWDRIFGRAGRRSAAENFEESCRRAPLDFVSELEAEDAAHAAELAPGQREMDV